MTDHSERPASVLARIARAASSAEGFLGQVQFLADQDERTLADQVELTEIPAPPFSEAARGTRMAELLAECGVRGVTTDPEGNVYGWLGADRADAPPLVIGAHLDTVFPAGTDVAVAREGGRLSGPGIADDGRGLAALLALARALQLSPAPLRAPLLVVATVGEEGVGDLRGVRHFFGGAGAGRHARAFISLDGAGIDRIVNRAVGSRRYRVTVRGPGGHSWADWGTPNPIHALADAVSRLDSLELGTDTTLSVGRVEGGTSVNAIPEHASMELEIRSTDESELVRLDAEVGAVLERAVLDRPDRRPDVSDGLTLDVDVIGNRPGGVTPDDDPLVAAALEATRALGHEAELTASSTDANVPMSLGIPAITLGAGGTMGRAHTLDEWYDNTDGVTGIARALLTLAVLDAYDAEAGDSTG